MAVQTVVISLEAYERLVEAEDDLERLREMGVYQWNKYRKPEDQDPEEALHEEDDDGTGDPAELAAELYPNGADWSN